MKNLKLPRKLKKALKSAMHKKYPHWETRYIGICGISNLPRFLNRESLPKAKGFAVTASSMGCNPVGAYK